MDSIRWGGNFTAHRWNGARRTAATTGYLLAPLRVRIGIGEPEGFTPPNGFSPLAESAERGQGGGVLIFRS